MTTPIPTLNNLNFELLDAIGKSTTEFQPENKEGSGSRQSRYAESMTKLKKRTDASLIRKESEIDSRVLQAILPMWDDDNRGVPNPIIRSGLFGVRNTEDRDFLQKMPIASLSNYTVRYSGQDLQQDDLSIWLSLINLARNQPVSDSVFFTGYALIKDLGWRMHSDSYKRAQHSIERLKVTGIEISANNHDTAYSGSLIREYVWTSEDAKGNARWMVRFEPKVSALFMGDSTTLLEWSTRKKIGQRARLAQWLHAFYSSHREPHPLPVEKIYELCRSGDSLSSFRRNIRNALERLITVDFLASYQIINDSLHVKKKIKPKLLKSA